MLLDELETEARSCRACALAEGRRSVVFGVGDAGASLMLVGEAPGEEEDRRGVPFVGRSGALLDRLLAEEVGVKRSECYVANVVKCRPPGNRDPRPDEVAACSRFLALQVHMVDPFVVVSLGNFATRALLGRSEGISRLRARSYPYGRGWLVPTFHPAAALRGGAEVVAKMRADLVRARLALGESR